MCDTTGAAPLGAVFLDAGLPDIELLTAGVRPDALCCLVPRDTDGLDAVLAGLLGLVPVPDLVFVAHARPGTLYLGSSLLDMADMRARPDSWRRLSCPPGGGVITLLGCEAAAGDVGRAFVMEMSRLTGRRVHAASTALGGGPAGRGRTAHDTVADAAAGTFLRLG